MFKASALGLLGLSLLVSCGKSSNKSGGMNPTKFIGIDGLGINQTAIYQSRCFSQKSEGETVYLQATFEVTMRSNNRADFKMKTVLFDKGCNSPMVESLVSGDGFLSADNTYMDSQIRSARMRTLDSNMTRYFNNEAVCGIRTWGNFSYVNVMYSECMQDDLRGDIYMNARENENALSVYTCESGTPLNSKCEKYDLRKI